MPYPRKLGEELGRFKNLGGATVVVRLVDRQADLPYELPGHPVMYVIVRGQCPGLGCLDPGMNSSHGASSCNCCGSNPDFEHALARAEREVCEWAQEHASECRAMPRP